MIIGIAFVVDELHKGQRLLFRYPEAVPSTVLNFGEELLDFHREYLSLRYTKFLFASFFKQDISPDNFAKLFRPKAALFNKILEIIVDDIHYISYPTPCSEELSHTIDGTSATTNVISLFNVIVATVRKSSLEKKHISKRLNGLKDFGSDPVTTVVGLLKDPRAPSSAMIGRVVQSLSRALLHQERQNRYVTKQVTLLLELLEGNIEGSNTTHSSDLSLPSLLPVNNSMINHHLPSSVTETNLNQANNLNLHSNFTSTLSLSSMTANTSPQQISTPPLDNAANLLNSMSLSSLQTEGLSSTSPSLNTGISNPHPANNLNNNSSNISTQNSYSHPVSLEPARIDTIDMMMANSTLANELRAVYHGLTGGVAVHLTVNDHISISIPLNTAVSSEETPLSDFRSLGSNQSPKPFDSSPTILPHQTLLLIAEPIVIFNVLLSLHGISSDVCVDTLVPEDWPMKCQGDDFSTQHNNIYDNTAHGTMNDHQQQIYELSIDLESRMGAKKEGSEDVSAVVTMERLKEELSHHISAVILDVILAADPSTPIWEISSKLEIPFDEMTEIASHLCSWGLAEIITTITESSRYEVVPNVERKVTKLARKTFRNLIKDASLDDILDRFNGQKSLREVVDSFPNQIQEYSMDILIWLLRFHMISELHTVFISLNDLKNGNLFKASSEPHGCVLPTTEVPPSDEQGRGQRARFPSQGNKQQFEDDLVLSRIIKYANGRTTIAEISWREKISEEVILRSVASNSSTVIATLVSVVEAN